MIYWIQQCQTNLLSFRWLFISSLVSRPDFFSRHAALSWIHRDWPAWLLLEYAMVTFQMIHKYIHEKAKLSIWWCQNFSYILCWGKFWVYFTFNLSGGMKLVVYNSMPTSKHWQIYWVITFWSLIPLTQTPEWISSSSWCSLQVPLLLFVLLDWFFVLFCFL